MALLTQLSRAREIDLREGPAKDTANPSGGLPPQPWARFPGLLFLALFSALACSSLKSEGQPPLSRESEVKAVLLFHLTQFVTWPPGQPPPNTPFKIGILGPDPFDNALEEVLRGETVAGRLILVERSASAKSLRDCQIVYISASGREPLRDALTVLKDFPILTVGEQDYFLNEGGMIQFAKTERQNLRLRINLDEARRHSLKISAQLLRVADVKEGGGS